MTEQQNVELVYIQTEVLAVTVKGTASHPSFPGVEFNEKESMLRIECESSYEAEVSGNAEIVGTQHLGNAMIGSYALRPLFFEQQRYEIIIEPLNGHKVEFWHENYNVRKNVTPVGRMGTMLSGVISFGNEIGMSDLMFLVDGKHYLKLTIEVFPSKISYKEDYKAIVADVTSEVYNLVFDFLKKTYDSFDISSRQQSSPVEFFAIIRKIYDEFIAAGDMVIAKPHHLLETEHMVLPGHKVKRMDNKTIRWIEKHPEQTKRSENGIMVNRALAVKKYVTYDTKENRLTKYMLQSTARRLEQFKVQYLKLSRGADDAVITEIDAMVRGINRRINTGFFREVTAMPANSGMSLVFGMAPGYRELYRCYLLLQHGLSVTGSVFNVSVKDLAVLYEYWCFIKLNSLMKDRYKLLSQDIVKVSGNGLFISLIKGQRSRVRYLNPRNGEIITLSYNPREISGPTVSQKPDNVLRLEKKGARSAYEYVFDAKYRINAALEGSMYKQMYHTPGPQEDDINTMHRYRDAIVYQNDAMPYERTMFGAYVLFPYHNGEEYRHHRFYRSIAQVNIGGLPFLPSETSMVSEMLDELISDSPDSAFERAILPLGIDDKLAKVDWAKRDVLIGTFRSKAQFDICFKNNFYYIPADRVLDKELPVHYIALYQTKSLYGENALGIQYYGEVLQASVVPRSMISEVHMRNGADPNAPYYRFTVREWIRLDKPILPRETGFIRAYTNLFLLQNSEYVPELLLKSEAEYRFYNELKRRTAASIHDENATVSGFYVEENKILFDEGRILLLQNDMVMDWCSIHEFARTPNAMFRRLFAQID